VTASPSNVLATLLLEPPPSLAAIVPGDGTVDLLWDPSPSSDVRDVEYVVMRRQVGASVFAPIARTSSLSYTDAPPASTFDYVVRTAVSSFSSGDSPIATATTGP
jgi:hypothetical protein